MRTFREMVNEETTVIYHGDDFGTKKLEPKLMNNGNNQEGIGIYFGDLETAESYGKYVITAEIDHKNFLDSRKPIGNFVSTVKISKILMELWKSDEEAMYYQITDWGVEISEPEDIEKEHIKELASKIANDDVRNFQITLAETYGVEIFVELWNKYIKKDGTYQKQNRDIWYAVINPAIKVRKYQ